MTDTTPELEQIALAPITGAEFDVFAEREHESDEILELIGGVIYDKISGARYQRGRDGNIVQIEGDDDDVPSNAFVSGISSRILVLLTLLLYKLNIAAHVTGEHGGYLVAGQRFAPDVAVLLKSRQAELNRTGYNSMPPDLAVEVDYPSTPASVSNLMIKVGYYLSAGTMVWLVFPANQTVHVYVPSQPPIIVGIDGVLDGGDVLPGLSLPVESIFAPDFKPV